MLPSRSLNSCVEWQDILSSLDLQAETTYLPTSTTCPLCTGGRLSILVDTQLGGQWYSCQKCGFAGDSTELVAEVTGKSHEDAAYDLFQDLTTRANRPSVAQTKRYVRQQIVTRQETNNLWEAAKADFIADRDSMEDLTSKLGIRKALSDELWREGPGKLIGSSDQDSLIKHYELRHKQWGHQLFKGGGWRKVVMTPSWDQPGRIAGMHFIGRNGNLKKDHRYRPSANYPIQGFRDAGLVMHPLTLEESLESWESTVFALPHPALVLTLTVKGFKAGNPGALPVVGWSDHGPKVRTSGAWKMLEGFQTIFWAPFFYPDLILQAFETDSLMSDCEHYENNNWEKVQNSLSKDHAYDFLTAVQRKAKPWGAITSRMLETLDTKYISEFAEYLENREVDVKRFAEELTRSGRRRLLGTISEYPVEHVAQLGDRTYVEKDDKWFIKSRKSRRSAAGAEETLSLVSDAVLRIDKIIYCENEKTSYAQGRILYKGSETPFYVDHDELEKGGLKWVQKKLISEGRGIVTFAPALTTTGLALATAFHEPEVVIGYDRVGWDASAGFVFPGYIVNTAGTCVEEPRAVFPDSAPCLEVPRPELYYSQRLEPLGAVSYENELFWAIFAGATGNILADALDEPILGTALVGAGAKRMGRIVAEKLGCLGDKYTVAKQESKLSAAEERHNWPVWVELTKRALSNSRWYDHPRNAMLPAEEPVAELLVPGREWVVIRGTDNVQRDFGKHVPASLITSFLSFIMAEKLVYKQEGPWPRTILAWCQRFLEAADVDPKVIDGARALTTYPGETGAESLVYGLSRKLADLSIVADDGSGPKQTGIGRLYVTENGIFIPRAVVDFIYTKQCVPPPPPNYITSAFDVEGVLLQAGTMRGQMGWEVSGEWFSKMRRRWTEKSYGLHQEFKLRIQG